ncbi:MAG: cyclophilin-like fold protein [Anaerolineae bacterium]
MRSITITAGSVSANASLNDSPTADAIWAALPIEARGNTWGDEIYFSIPVKLAEADDAKEVVALGDLGYWAPGTAFCIFFGRTPVSGPGEIRPASAVNVFGHIDGDATVFKKVANGAKIRIERA